MSVSLIEDPQLIMPVYNNIVFTVNSTNKANCSFKYVCDVYVNGVYVTRLKLFPKGANGYAEFKVNRVLEDFVTYDLQKNLTGFRTNDNSILAYVLKFGEEYSTGCDGVTTIFPDLTVTSAFYAWNAALQYREWKDFDYTDFQMDGTSKRFLTNAPSGHLIKYSDSSVLNMFNLTSSVIDFAEVKTYDSSDNLLGTYTINNTFTTVSTTARRLLSLGCGPDNLNKTTLASGSQPVITTSVAYYTVQLWNDTSPDVAVSELYAFEIDTRDTRFETKRFWWLNRLGAFDSYSFTLRDTRKVAISKSKYSKLLGGLSGSEWTYTLGDRGQTVLNVIAQESGTVLSNWLSEDEALWMEELFTSPEVYITEVNGDGCDVGGTGVTLNIDPIVITSSTFEEKVKKTTKNINYTIEYDKAYEKNVQRN